MRLPGMHALLTAGVAVLTTAGTVSAVSLTAAVEAEPPPRPAPPAAPAPAAPAPPPVPVPAPVPATGGTVEPDPTTGDARPVVSDPAVGPDPVEPAPAAPDETPEATAEPTRDRPPGVPEQDAPREEKIRFACEQGWMTGSLCP